MVSENALNKDSNNTRIRYNVFQIYACMCPGFTHQTGYLCSTNIELMHSLSPVMHSLLSPKLMSYLLSFNNIL